MHMLRRGVPSVHTLIQLLVLVIAPSQTIIVQLGRTALLQLLVINVIRVFTVQKTLPNRSTAVMYEISSDVAIDSLTDLYRVIIVLTLLKYTSVHR